MTAWRHFSTCVEKFHSFAELTRKTYIFFLLSSKRVPIIKADFACFNPVKVWFAIFSTTKNSNLPLQSVSILRLAKLTWLHNCDVVTRVEDNL